MLPTTALHAGTAGAAAEAPLLRDLVVSPKSEEPDDAAKGRPWPCDVAPETLASMDPARRAAMAGIECEAEALEEEGVVSYP